MSTTNKILIPVLILSILFPLSLNAVPTEAYQSYVRGLLASRAGDLKAALKEYERVIMLDNKAALAYRELAYLYLQFGRAEEAYAAARKLNELSGSELETQLFLGSFYLMSRQPMKAIKAWKKALDIDPENETAILYLAAYFSDKDPQKAIEYWEKYTKKRPDYAKGYFQLGSAQEKSGQLKKARESFEKAADLEPSGTEAYLSLAQIYEKEGNLDAAIEEYKKYLSKLPDNITVLMYLGGLYYRLEKYEEAEEIFNRALKLNPDDENIYFWLGILAEKKKDWPSAIKYFEFIRQKDENAVVLTRLSFYYSASKDNKRAIKYLKKVASIEPDNPNSYYLLGLAYFDLKKYRLAERNFRKALYLKPDYIEIYFHLGVLYDNWGRFNKAVVELKKAIESDPENSTALNYLGYSWADRGINLDEAENLIKKALELDPENAAYIDSLGWVYYKKGLYKQAEELLNKAASKLSDAVVWEHLGDVNEKLDNKAEAWEYYNKALDLDPKNKKVLKKLNKIKKFVLPNTLQRKVLKRAVGNLLQVKTLKANFVVSARTSTENIRSFGVLRYSRPDKWRIDILGNFLAPQIVIIHNETTTVYPKALQNNISGSLLDQISRIKDYFNSNLVDEFDTQTASIQTKGNNYIYSMDNNTLVINSNNGSIERLKKDKEIELIFKKQTLFEGLYLPSEVYILLPKDDISAEIKVKNFILNSQIKDDVYTVDDQ